MCVDLYVYTYIDIQVLVGSFLYSVHMWSLWALRVQMWRIKTPKRFGAYNPETRTLNTRISCEAYRYELVSA